MNTMYTRHNQPASRVLSLYYACKINKKKKFTRYTTPPQSPITRSKLMPLRPRFTLSSMPSLCWRMYTRNSTIT